MSKEHIYEVWAPSESPWSNWVKPVLFACMDDGVAAHAFLAIPDRPEWFPLPQSTALVIDLPGNAGVRFGLMAALAGFRPVPLYNALPWPASRWEMGGSTGVISVVDVQPIMGALWRGTEILLGNALPDDAPPAFLLDANRRVERNAATPGRFDNRSVSFTTDFPSANFLLAHGIRDILLVQETGHQPQADLAHTLRKWQEAGLTLQLKRLDEVGLPTTLIVEKPWWFGMFWQRLLSSLGLRRSALGGFGGMVPEPSNG